MAYTTYGDKRVEKENSSFRGSENAARSRLPFTCHVPSFSTSFVISDLTPCSAFFPPLTQRTLNKYLENSVNGFVLLVPFDYSIVQCMDSEEKNHRYKSCGLVDLLVSGRNPS